VRNVADSNQGDQKLLDLDTEGGFLTDRQRAEMSCRCPKVKSNMSLASPGILLRFVPLRPAHCVNALSSPPTYRDANSTLQQRQPGKAAAFFKNLKVEPS
jgi:hypothetical protein